MQSPDEIVEKSLRSADGLTSCEDFLGLVQSWLNKIQVPVFSLPECLYCVYCLILDDLLTSTVKGKNFSCKSKTLHCINNMTISGIRCVWLLQLVPAIFCLKFAFLSYCSVRRVLRYVFLCLIGAVSNVGQINIFDLTSK